jgi:glycosyltransferase involved in cell wall biosynthesis
MPTPPITLARVAGTLKKKHKAPIYLILRDIFPQNAVDLGFFRKGDLIHRYFRNKEKKLYRLADRIGCMSPANIQYIINNNPGLGSSRLHELKNFQILYEKEGSQKQELRGKYDLEDMFVVVFGGNMGKPQQLGNVIELASRCMKYEDVLFLLLGEGIMVERIRNKITERGVNNIRIINTIPKREYQDLLSVCDVGLISLNERFTIPNIPSKTLDYFNVGLPVLASIDRATDYNVILEEAGAGLWSYAGNHDALMKNFETLYNDPELRRRMAQNGRDYFIRNLTPDIAYNTIINSLN